MNRTLILAACLLAAVAHAEDAPRFDARETLRRAEVGTYSARGTLPVRKDVKPIRGPASEFERIVCREDPADPINQSIVCVAKEGKP
jgi:hypothetical protein